MSSKDNKFSFLAGEYDSSTNLNSNAPEIGRSDTWGKATPEQTKAAKEKQKENKLQELRKEREEEENGDSPAEKRLMVIDGTKLQCPHNQGVGILKVTSNEIKLQDKIWATEGDGNNMVNLQFPGVCNHPKWGDKKPPCMSVINLSPWQNLGTTTVQEQKVLVKESCIDCNPTPNSAVASPIPKVESISNNENHIGKAIKNAKWVQNLDDKEITCLLYGVKKVYVRVELWNPCNGKKINIKYKEYNSIATNTDLDRDTNYTILNDSLIQYCPIAFTIDDYIKHDEDDVGEYIFEIKIEDEEHKPKKKLKVHAVIYIPEIMEHLGWPEAAKVQKRWFNGDKNDYPWEGEPNINGISIDWILGFDRVNKIYTQNKTKWKNDKAIIQLRKEIAKMFLQGQAVRPTKTNTETTFGTFNSAIKTISRKYKDKNDDELTIMEKVPIFDDYYFQSFVFEENMIGTMDDFYGTIANCTFRFVAKGTLKYIDDKKINATITEIGIYMRDGFDFVGSQNLGFWSLEKKDVQRHPFGTSYRLVDNDSYRDYRDDAQKGGDFYNYSTLKIIQEEYTFTL